MAYTAKNQNFHGQLLQEIYAFRPTVAALGQRKEFIIQERQVSYRITSHFHPYVGPLMQRLLRKGVPGLQAADTEYNTRVTLTNATAAKDSNGQALTMPAGEVVHLADGAPLMLEGVAVRLAGNKILRLSDEVAVTPAAGQALVLAAQTEARRATGAVARLDGDTAATLTDGAPRPVLFADIFSPTRYNPSALVTKPYPVKELDFTSGGAYSAYNWELFFHVPLTIAMHLSKTGRHAEAQRWFHFLFDPTDDSDGPTPERFWKVRPFQTTDVQKIEEILVNLATNANETLRDETIQSINAWQDAPFRPHVVARYRQQAYMYKTVMAYLDNLIAWGDALFRQDTGEAIDEALILYVLAANILGPRPQAVPSKGTVRPQTYDNLRKDLQLFGVVLRDAEADIGFDSTPPPAEDGDNPQLATVRSLGKALYFCVPRNDKLLSYWDTVADRLFKIHNSLNIQGIFRQLALFEPPIDPAMLARAAAAGLDVSAIINGLNQPLPLVRFQLLAQKAAEVVQEVKSLGNSLLSAMEKEDGEALGLLRAKHERAILELVEQVKYGQVQEAIKAREGLLGSLALAVQRYAYYELQLGRSLDDIQKAIPELNELDEAGLEKMKFKMDEPALQPAELKVDIAASLEEAGGKIFSSFEASEFESLARAVGLRGAAAELDMAGKFLSLIPDFGAQAEPWGIGAAITFGGKALSTGMALMADSDRISSDKATHQAGKSSRIAGYDRRQLDWAFQSNQAVGEINQIFKQLRAAQLRQAVAELELRNHRQQMKHAVEIEQFLNEEGTHKTGKKTNKSLYAWMKREVRGLYGQVFQFAFDIAKKAERALQHELGDPSLSYLQFGYLAGKEGLLAGEKLYLDVKRMEMAYLELNRREYELTKHVSLLQVDPLALLELRATGRCTLRLPEELFDMDGPGHYFRRIKSVAVSIPCVTGPYAGVNCTLTLLKSSIRTTPVVGDDYARADAEDTRFSDYFGSLQSIVTSSGQNDSGLFETNLRDERYLPFENSGVISEWQLQLPANPSKGEPRQFDYDTISDVILHVRYTAREGGGLLRQGAVAHNNDLFAEARAVGAVRLFSVRHEFPGEWARLQPAPAAGQRHALTLNLRPEHFPFWSQGRLGTITRVDVVARSAETPAPGSLDVFDKVNDDGEAARKVTLAKRADWGGLLAGALTDEPDSVPLPAPEGEWRLFFEKPLAELWVALRWGE